MEHGITEHEACLRRLPTPYSLALRLRDAGVDESVMCTYLGVEPEALVALLDIAEAKLATVRLAQRSSGTTAAPPTY